MTQIPATLAANSETSTTEGRRSDAPKKAAQKRVSESPNKFTVTQPDAATAEVATLDDLIPAFLDHLRAIGKSAGTTRSYRADLSVARKHFGGDAKISKLTVRKVAAFFESETVTKLRGGRAKNPITIAKIRRVFRQTLVFAAEAGHIESAPLPAGAK